MGHTGTVGEGGNSEKERRKQETEERGEGGHFPVTTPEWKSKRKILRLWVILVEFKGLFGFHRSKNR